MSERERIDAAFAAAGRNGRREATALMEQHQFNLLSHLQSADLILQAAKGLDLYGFAVPVTDPKTVENHLAFLRAIGDGTQEVGPWTTFSTFRTQPSTVIVLCKSAADAVMMKLMHE